MKSCDEIASRNFTKKYHDGIASKKLMSKD